MQKQYDIRILKTCAAAPSGQLQLRMKVWGRVVKGVFGVRKQDKEWVIDHIPTGLLITGELKLMQDAIDLIKEFWDDLDEEAIESSVREVAAVAFPEKLRQRLIRRGWKIRWIA